MEIGKEYKIFDEGLEASVGKVQTELEKLGGGIGETATKATQLLEGRVELTKGPIKTKANQTMETLLKETASMVKNKKIEVSQGKARNKLIKEFFGDIGTVIDEGGNSLETIRKLKTTVYQDRLSKSAYNPNTVDPMKTETLKSIARGLSGLERDALEVNIEQVNWIYNNVAEAGSMLQDEVIDVSEALQTHLGKLSDYGKLKELETILVKTGESQPTLKIGGWEDMLALGGAIGGYGDLAIPAIVLKKLWTQANTPVGKFWIAKHMDAIARKKPQAVIDAIAAKIGVSSENITKYVQQENLVAAQAALTDN
jgi:hypothetical protein